MQSREVIVAALQMDSHLDPRTNLDRCIANIEAAATKGAQIVLTPQFFNHRYFCQDSTHTNFALAEQIPGPTTERLMRVAANRGVVIVASLFERRTLGIFHSTVIVIDADGSSRGLYRQMHIPENRDIHEGFYFTPGDLGFRSFDTRYARIGVLVGWDAYFPEAARIVAMHGAEILCCAAARGPSSFDSTTTNDQLEAWETIQRSHAIANGVYYVVANRVGREAERATEFWGASFVANHSGSIIAQARNAVEETVLANCKIDKVEVRRTHWPFLRDRRVDAYSALLSRSSS